MTREEAKEVFINRGYVNVKGGTVFDGDKWRQSVEVITEWLKEQPCEDAISRQAAIDAIENEQKKIMRSDWAIDQAKFSAMSEIRELIADLPSVSTEKIGRWITIERELPELNKPLLVTAYHRVCYAHMISKNGNYGYPVFRLHELKDSDRGWVQETISHEPYSMGRIDAWMYIDIPQPYKAESEDKE